MAMLMDQIEELAKPGHQATATLLFVLPVLVMFGMSVPATGHAEAVPDSGLVRLRVHENDVTIALNGEPILNDSHGNPLLPGAWFILRVPIGLHLLSLKKDRFLPMERHVIVTRKEVATLEITLSPQPTDGFSDGSPSDSVRMGLGRILVFSDPPNASVLLQEPEVDLKAPAQLMLHAGEHVIQVSAEGHEPLEHHQSLLTDQRLALRFLLKQNPPPLLSPADLDLEYKPVVPLLNEEEADIVDRKFTALTETFANIPLGQGLLARLVAGKGVRSTANFLVISGAALTASSYALGKILSSRKRTDILTQNEIITESNIEAQNHNSAVDRTLRTKQRELLSTWERDNADRGRVESTPQQP
jgi:hypothetical protein